MFRYNIPIYNSQKSVTKKCIWYNRQSYKFGRFEISRKLKFLNCTVRSIKVSQNIKILHITLDPLVFEL